MIGSIATSRDVALLAKVSQSSVSRAFTPGSSLSEDKRERILKAARLLNYVPNSMASSMITRRSNMIGIVVGNIDNPFYLNVLKRFIFELQRLGRQVLTFTIEPGASTDDIILRVLQHQVDGIVLTAAQLSTTSTSLCRARGIPIVLFNRYIPGSEADVVRCDNQSGAEILARHFLAAGARSYAIVRGDPMGTTSQDRVDGFCQALWAGGIARDRVTEIEGHSSYDAAFDAIVAAYREAPGTLPDAIFSVSDIMALGVLDALRSELGLHVPDDILVAGFDGIPEGARAPYRLTTMRQPIDQMVAETLALLTAAATDREGPAGLEILLSSEIIWRDTLRPIAPCVLGKATD